jgi:hypothetical protein
MKNILIGLFLFVGTLLGADITNGVFHVNNPIDCVFVSQNGNVRTNSLETGRTYVVGSTLMELKSIDAAYLSFSGGPMMLIGPKSELTILLFDQEVENLTFPPHRATFGCHTLNMAFTKGEFSIVYPNKNSNSSVNINTRYADYELTGGKYYFKLTSKSALVYVVDGGMVVHNNKKADVVDKGNLVVAVPFADTDSGLDDKIIISVKRAKPEEVEKFSSPLLPMEKYAGDMAFYVIDGKVVGIPLK